MQYLSYIICCFTIMLTISAFFELLLQYLFIFFTTNELFQLADA